MLDSVFHNNVIAKMMDVFIKTQTYSWKKIKHQQYKYYQEPKYLKFRRHHQVGMHSWFKSNYNQFE